MMWVQFLTYASVIVAVVAMIAKVMRYVTAPESMRWELYPVPHEKGRAEYGGSYLEELDWWSKKRHSDMVNEFKEMFEEIILLKGVFHNNKKVWTFSFPFHLGMYISIGWLVLLLGGAILQAAGVAIGAQAGGFGMIVHYATIVTGYVGLALSGIGAIGLFFWRAGDSRQRPYNAPIEYFNLLFFAALVIVALAAQIGGDSQMVFLRGYVQSLVTFKGITIPTGLLTAELVMISLMILYIPLTRMSHFVAKYFLYHAVRWNDEPNERGSKIEKSLLKNLKYKVSWQADHMGAGKTWGEAVTDSGEKKNG